MKPRARAAGLGFLVSLVLPVSLVAQAAPAVAQAQGHCFVRDEFEDIVGPAQLAGTQPEDGPLWVSGNGSLQLNDPPGSDGWVSAGTAAVDNYATLAMNNGDGSATAVISYPSDGLRLAGISFRVQNANNRMWVGTARDNNVWSTYLQKRVNGVTSNLATGTAPAHNGFRTLKVEFTGTNIVVKWDGSTVITWSGTTALESFNAHGPSIVDNTTIPSTNVNVRRYEATSTNCSTAVPLPDYRCGRTIRDLGGGQFFVDLEAASLYPAFSDMQVVVPPGSGTEPYRDTNFGWNTSWGSGRTAVTFRDYLDFAVQSTTPEKVTLALPSISTMPPGGWSATFTVTRTIPQNKPTATSVEQLGQGGFVNLDPDGPGPRGEESNWLARFLDGPLGPQVYDLWNATVKWEDGGWLKHVRDRPNTHKYLPPQSHQLKNDAGALLTSAGAWREVVGQCTVTIDPLNPESDTKSSSTAPTPPPPPGSPTTTTTTSTTTPGGTTTTLPAGNNETQGEDGTKNDCSAGFLGRVPVVGGLFDATARLVCALKQLLVELFVPDDLGQHGTDSKATSIFAPASAVLDVGAAFNAGYSPGGCDGPTVTLPDLPGFGGMSFKPLDACSAPMSSLANVLRTGLSVVLWVGGAMFLFRVFMVVSGLGEGID